MGVSYNRNTGLALDANLALHIVDAGVSVRTLSCSDPRLKLDAWFLRPASEVERRVAQTRVRCGVLYTRVGWDAELLRLAFESRHGILQTRV